MKFAIGGDSTPYITKSITKHLEDKGIDLIKCGALKGMDVNGTLE